MIKTPRAPPGKLLAYREPVGSTFTWASGHDSHSSAGSGASALQQMMRDTAAQRRKAYELAFLILPADRRRP